MVKIALIQFQSNLAVSISGAKRQDFKKGTKIIVPENEVIPLMRLGCTVISKYELDYKKDKKVLDGLFKAKVEDEFVETPKTENADTPEVGSPKVDTPETETPKVEDEVVETPKV